MSRDPIRECGDALEPKVITGAIYVGHGRSNGAALVLMTVQTNLPATDIKLNKLTSTGRPPLI